MKFKKNYQNKTRQQLIRIAFKPTDIQNPIIHGVHEELLVSVAG